MTVGNKILQHMEVAGTGKHLARKLDDQHGACGRGFDGMKLAGPYHQQIILFQDIGFGGYGKNSLFGRQTQNELAVRVPVRGKTGWRIEVCDIDKAAGVKGNVLILIFSGPDRS